MTGVINEVIIVNDIATGIPKGDGAPVVGDIVFRYGVHLSDSGVGEINACLVTGDSVIYYDVVERRDDNAHIIIEDKVARHSVASRGKLKMDTPSISRNNVVHYGIVRRKF